MQLADLIRIAHERRASDIHIVCGIPVRLRVDGRLENLDDHILTAAECEAAARDLLPPGGELPAIGECDLAVTAPDGTRCRVNLFRQQGHISVALRLLSDTIPDFAELGLPDITRSFTTYKRGIVLVTGETGSGKSTTLACLLNHINKTTSQHIITLEQPIEYIYHSDRCVVNQREVGRDTQSFTDGLNAILREDPDVILVGEMRQLTTIETALVAAETGHLVFATLHTSSAADSVDRIVNVFPPSQQAQIRLQLSMTIRAVISQQLLPRSAGPGRVLASEIMVANGAIRNLIREGKTPQITNAIATSGDIGNHLMDNDLLRLFRMGDISAETAMAACHDPEAMRRILRY